MPGGTGRNWASYGHKISPLSDHHKAILADPQTSGGLLVSVDAEKAAEFENFVKGKGYELRSFGKLVQKSKEVIRVA